MRSDPTTGPTGFRCRASGSTHVEPVLSLGRTPLANALLTSDQLVLPEATYPLDVVLCPESALLQITETVPPEILFREYVYFSSFSDTMLDSARALARRLIGERRLGPGSLVLEVASNDGYLLRNYHQAGVPVLGIEPARNVAQVATSRGIPTREEFFGKELAAQLRSEGRVADVVHANNVLAHVADLPGVVDGLRSVLKDDGIAVVEVPYVKDMLDHCEFDTIYHEHLCYFSLTALDRLFRGRGLVIEDVERLSIHGGTIRVFAGPDRAGRRPSDAVHRLLEDEAAWGVSRPDAYLRFASQVDVVRTRLRALLQDLKKGGARIAAYGAAAKGSTLLNYCDIGREILDYVVDRSPAKHGRFMPGIRLPILAPERLLTDLPDYVLLLTWNFAAEVMEQQANYLARGGRFVIPVPVPRVA